MASIRMSDIHHASDMYRSLTPKIMLDHPEWRIRQADDSIDVALDYTFEGVRNHRLAILEELVTNYDINGLELDFMRSCRYFPAHLAKERIPVMTEFVSTIRAMMDRVAKQKQCNRFLLGIRVPPSLNECPGLGLDPTTWVQNGWIDYLASYILISIALRSHKVRFLNAKKTISMSLQTHVILACIYPLILLTKLIWPSVHPFVVTMNLA